jgi:hypothetical protein
MAERDKVWEKVEGFIRAQGFSCVDEHAPVLFRKYRKGVAGLQVVIEPAFTDKGRGRLRFECAAVSVYEAERCLTGFAWYPGQQLSQAMDKALQRQMKRVQNELRLAEERLASSKRDYQLCQVLTDWCQSLTYGSTTGQSR